MRFSDLNSQEKIKTIKLEFTSTMRQIFEYPEILKEYVEKKQITDDDANNLVKVIDELNFKTCACCRKFDETKLQMTPIKQEFIPILTLAQTIVKDRSF